MKIKIKAFALTIVLILVIVLSGCHETYSQQEASSDFLELKQDFQTVENYLSVIKDNYHSCVFDGASGSVTVYTLGNDRYRLNEETIDITDVQVKKSLSNLFGNNIVRISINSTSTDEESTYIDFAGKGTLSDLYQGIIYTETACEYLKDNGYELCELTEPNWYYYEKDYVKN